MQNFSEFSYLYANNNLYLFFCEGVPHFALQRGDFNKIAQMTAFDPPLFFNVEKWGYQPKKNTK